MSEYFREDGTTPLQATNVSNAEAEATNERTDLDSYTLLSRKNLEHLTQSLEAVVESAVETDVYFSNDQGTLDTVYAETVSELLRLRSGVDALIKNVTTTYRVRSVK